MQSEQMLHYGISHFATSGHKIKRRTNSRGLGIDSQANSCLHIYPTPIYNVYRSSLCGGENTVQENVFQISESILNVRSEQMSCWCWKRTHCYSLLPGSSGCWDWNPGCPSSSSPPPSPSLSRQRRGRRVRSSMGLHPPPWTSSWEAHSWC